MTDPAPGSRWHVAADGTVLKSYPKALDHTDTRREPPQGLKYLRYATERPVALADLQAMDERVARSMAGFGRLTAVTLVAGVLGIAGVLAGWIVLPLLGAPDAAGVTFVVSVPLVAAGFLALVIVPGAMRGSVKRAGAAAGLAPDPAQVVKEPEARAVLDAPGTVSGPAAR
ncbi:hypothetical protein ACFQS3_15505 [Glycomyces mayteni]|uniref:Holin-X, holin superfamily III n=1 Tax=Glycomyces mayteni TaxID=543887 RepID=A0ABW2DBQ8_9ACTN|nr:hypothetical protein GCM10025732_16760 [Glycomyces mayteni]